MNFPRHAREIMQSLQKKRDIVVHHPNKLTKGDD